jgi:excisionase family DNA binding protein
MATATLDPVSAPQAQEEQIHELHDLLQKEGKARLLTERGSALDLPQPVYHLLLQILEGMQQGKAISVVPVTQDLTTQQAAEMLGVSRPFFVKLLEADELPFHLAGTHRRVYLRDLLDYKQRRDQGRRTAIERMAAAAEEAGVYDRVLLPES